MGSGVDFQHLKKQSRHLGIVFKKSRFAEPHLMDRLTFG